MHPQWLIAVLLLASAPGIAQERAPCTSIDEDAERLRCYDAVSGRAAPAPLAAATATGPAAPPNAEEISLWEQRLLDDAKRQTFTLTAYRPSYLMYTSLQSLNDAPYRFADPDERLRDQELKFYLGVQTKLVDDLFGNNADLWFGYTQTAYWQAFAEDTSAPFRETDHEPEAHLSFLTDYPVLGFTARGLNVGVMHQSNGRGGSLSRSWNRLFAELQLIRGDLNVGIKPWVRVGDIDDNPDIENYFGNYEVRATWRRSDHLYSVTLRNAFDHRYGTELSWSFPIAGQLRGIVQWYYGYSENVIDYDYKNNRIGIGFLMSDWL